MNLERVIKELKELQITLEKKQHNKQLLNKIEHFKSSVLKEIVRLNLELNKEKTQ